MGWENNTNLWYIPMQYNIITYKNGKYHWISPKDREHFFFLMPPTKNNVTHTIQDSIHVGPESAVIVNVNYNGPYHVIYDNKNWKRIGSVLMQNHQLIPAGTRLQLFHLLDRQPSKYPLYSISQIPVPPGLIQNIPLKLCIGEYVQVITHDVLTMELCNSVKYFYIILLLS